MKKSLTLSLLIIIIVISLLMIIGTVAYLCGYIRQNTDNNNDKAEKTNTNTGFKMPHNYIKQTFEVSASGVSEGFTMQIYDITTEKAANLSEIWRKSKAKKEGQDKYDTIRKIYDDTSLEDEETEMEYYCNSLFSNSCMEMKYTYDRNGCRKVTVECKKYNCDDICIKYDININPDYLDNSDCVE
jgi:hypothetical protein